MKKSLIPAACMLLSACSQPAVHKFDSPFYKIPVDSTLVLNQDITIPANQARALIQYGKVVTRKQVDQYAPSCEFEVLTLKDTDQVIHPDRFRIKKLSKDIQFSSRPVMYASRILMAVGESKMVAYNTVMYLESQQQPDVYRMSCLYWTDEPMDNHLTKNQISKALGDIFTLDIKT